MPSFRQNRRPFRQNLFYSYLLAFARKQIKKFFLKGLLFAFILAFNFTFRSYE